MAGKLTRNPSKWRPFLCGGDKACSSAEKGPNSDTSVMNLSDTVFEFLDDSVSTAEREQNNDDDDDDGDGEDDKAFWEKKNNLLQSTLFRTSSIESRIRDATHEALKELQMTLNYCCCGRPGTESCRSCLMIEVCSRMRDAGFNCAVSKSKWKRSSDLQAGEHTFLDVIEDTINPKTGLRGVIVIELNFRGEFEMAKANEEYNELIKKLPEVFVGKMHRLESSIKILCSAAKKCMKDKKMYLGPWRKKEYMKAKWLVTCQRITPAPASVTPLSDRTNTGRKTRASMLTADLLENSTTQGLQLFSFF
ncbi:uncharacterized protein LOC124915344 [Impatiens glandulifera]|uniref:uncharacterized protein LOC124915344 n=1 Tax=Impatiens glandulifera TaxID=253017 RepID=UPI001FB10023|nr:uncharacterized protein LOC124915344 [Impatiens glandulifera]